MITDRFTARVLGALVLSLALIIDVSCFLFARPETRSQPRFGVVVAVSSIPLFAIGAWLLRKASSLKETE